MIDEYYGLLVTAGDGDPIEVSDEDIMPPDLPSEKSPSDMSAEEFAKLLEDIGGPQAGQEVIEVSDEDILPPDLPGQSKPELPQQESDTDTPSFDLHYNPLPDPEETSGDGLTSSEIENFIRETNPDVTPDELKELMPDGVKEDSPDAEPKEEYLKMIEESPFDILDSERYKEAPYNTPEYAHPLVKSIFKHLDKLGEGTRRMPTIWQYKIREAIEYMLDILKQETEKRS